MKMIKNKSKGVEVKILQTFLNISVDGKFGPKTTTALNNWKRSLGLDTNGEMTEVDWNILAKSLPTIQKNDKNKYVKMWQLFLGITADGNFGDKTKASTRAYQSSAKLTIDGIVGSKTWIKAFTGQTESIPDPIPAPISNKNLQPINYKQYDSRWASVVFTKNNTYNKKQTIKSSGCGPTSMADIVATWWNKSATPKTLAALAVEKGYRTTNSGTAWGFFKFCANKYGASKFIQTTSTATLKAALQEGAYAVVSFGPSKWTNGGCNKMAS